MNREEKYAGEKISVVDKLLRSSTTHYLLCYFGYSYTYSLTPNVGRIIIGLRKSMKLEDSPFVCPFHSSFILFLSYRPHLFNIKFGL